MKKSVSYVGYYGSRKDLSLFPQQQSNATVVEKEKKSYVKAKVEHIKANQEIEGVHWLFELYAKGVLKGLFMAVLILAAYLFFSNI